MEVTLYYTDLSADMLLLCFLLLLFVCFGVCLVLFLFCFVGGGGGGGGAFSCPSLVWFKNVFCFCLFLFCFSQALFRD